MNPPKSRQPLYSRRLACPLIDFTIELIHFKPQRSGHLSTPNNEQWSPLDVPNAKLPPKMDSEATSTKWGRLSTAFAMPPSLVSMTEHYNSIVAHRASLSRSIKQRKCNLIAFNSPWSHIKSSSPNHLISTLKSDVHALATHALLQTCYLLLRNLVLKKSFLALWKTSTRVATYFTVYASLCSLVS